MADNFTQFVLGLASDPQQLSQFQKNPDAAMSSAGLSGAEASVLKSGNSALIRQAITRGVAGAAGESDIVIVVVLSPAPESFGAASSLSRTVPTASVLTQNILSRFKTP
jgi:hypothetical protein